MCLCIFVHTVSDERVHHTHITFTISLIIDAECNYLQWLLQLNCNRLNGRLPSIECAVTHMQRDDESAVIRNTKTWLKQHFCALIESDKITQQGTTNLSTKMTWTVVNRFTWRQCRRQCSVCSRVKTRRTISNHCFSTCCENTANLFNCDCDWLQRICTVVSRDHVILSACHAVFPAQIEFVLVSALWNVCYSQQFHVSLLYKDCTEFV